MLASHFTFSCPFFPLFQGATCSKSQMYVCNLIRIRSFQTFFFPIFPPPRMASTSRCPRLGFPNVSLLDRKLRFYLSPPIMEKRPPPPESRGCGLLPALSPALDFGLLLASSFLRLFCPTNVIRIPSRRCEHTPPYFPFLESAP